MFNLIPVVVLALIVSALVSGSETALLAVNKYLVKDRATGGDRRAARVLSVLRRPENMFGAILLINNLANILIATLIGVMVSEVFGGNSAWTVVIATAITTVLIVVFSELLPKSLAAAVPMGWSLAASTPMRSIIYVSTPLIYGFSLLPRAVLKVLGLKQEIAAPTITPDELRRLVDIGEEQGEVEDSQGKMLENVFRFSERTVSDIMTPRPDIKWVQHEDSVSDFLETYLKENHVRFPVWDEQRTDVAGIVSSKDVLAKIARGEKEQKIKPLMRRPLFVPEFQQLDELFAAMRHNGSKMAIALDEFGGIAGLVTLTSLVEQVVGSTGEEGQRPPKLYRKIAENTYSVSGRLLVEDLRDELEIDVPEGDYDTVGGWFLSLFQKVPEQGDEVRWRGIVLTASRMDGNRIAEVVIKRAE